MICLKRDGKEEESPVERRRGWKKEYSIVASDYKKDEEGKEESTNTGVAANAPEPKKWKLPKQIRRNKRLLTAMLLKVR